MKQSPLELHCFITSMCSSKFLTLLLCSHRFSLGRVNFKLQPDNTFVLNIFVQIQMCAHDSSFQLYLYSKDQLLRHLASFNFVYKSQMKYFTLSIYPALILLQCARSTMLCFWSPAMSGLT